MLAAEHPERVAGAVFIGPALPLAATPRVRRPSRTSSTTRSTPTRAGRKYNRHYWLRRLHGFLEFFFAQVLHRAALHQADRGLRRLGPGDDAGDADRHDAPAADRSTTRGDVARCAAACGCPAWSSTATRTPSPAQPRRGARRARRRRARALEGGGHIPHARDPVRVNLLSASSSTGSPTPARPAPRWTRGRERAASARSTSPRRSGSATPGATSPSPTSCASCVPDLEIDWLAQHPVTRCSAARGERIHPASALLANESAHIESRVRASTTCTASRPGGAWTRSSSPTSWSSTTSSRTSDYDLVDRRRGLGARLLPAREPRAEAGRLRWLTDFVGWLPMPDGGEREAFLTADYNAEMIEHIERYPRLRDRAIFVGEARRHRARHASGPDLPAIRDWTEEHYDFSGATSPASTRPSSPTARRCAPSSATRRRAGLHRHRRRLRRRRPSAAPGDRGVSRRPSGASRAAHDRRRRPAHRPRVAARRTPASRCARYVHDLYRHLAACDLAVVQGGLTTTMELDRQQHGRSSTSHSATTSSRTSTSPTDWTATAPAAAWTTRPRRPK